MVRDGSATELKHLVNLAFDQTSFIVTEKFASLYSKGPVRSCGFANFKRKRCCSLTHLISLSIYCKWKEEEHLAFLNLDPLETIF